VDGEQWPRVGALIVDDEDDLRLLVRLMIERHNKGLFVSGEASSGRDAIAQVDVTQPSVVVLDQMMPGMDGVETAARILERTALAQGITTCLLKDRVRDLPRLVLDVARR
jgi:CheY-like chemotaxis protein